MLIRYERNIIYPVGWPIKLEVGQERKDGCYIYVVRIVENLGFNSPVALFSVYDISIYSYTLNVNLSKFLFPL